MTVRTVGIISAGDMGSGIGSFLAAHGLDVATNLDGRSELTHTRAAEAGMRDAGGIDGVVNEADLILSVLAPSEAESIAEQVAAAMRSTGKTPAFAECNAIAPQTVVRIGAIIEKAGAAFIDAGIIGTPPKADKATAHFPCSGPDTSPFEELAEHGLNVFRVGPTVGQASGLKMVYAAGTKGTFALWTELFTAARAMNLSDALLSELANGDVGISERMIKGIPTTPRRARRWIGEMEEIALTFEGLGLTPNILIGAADMFRLEDETPLADQTSRDPDPSLDTILDVLAAQAAKHRKDG
jgi:3-hydroxyisobutyrate dehydrogenase-like beta-hydroxyacid dehydrogenase